MNNEIVVIDNIIPKKYQEEIFYTICNGNFPYYFYRSTCSQNPHDSENLSLMVDKNDIATFTHKLVSDGANNSEHTEKILEPFVRFKDRLDSALQGTSYNIDYNKISRLQATIVAERRNKFSRFKTPWHVDMLDDHLVMIYYIVDADGKIFFKNGDSVVPKQGRCVIFDGKMEHRIELSSSYRGTLNFNILY
jgi:hypothetical protein